MLSKIEEILLLMVCKLADEAFAMQIREEVKELTGKPYSIGGIYVPLDRMVKRGWLTMQDLPGEAKRMGRPRRKYLITAEGLRLLKESHELQSKMWNLPEGIINKIMLS
ncbi:MAG: helix-turn-helix transcriptional regulator [Bacteroidota bacterium]